MITTLAFWHCACAESPDIIRPLGISSVELWSTLFVPPRMKLYFMLQFNYVLKNNFSKRKGTCLNLILKNHQSTLFLLVILAIKNYAV